MLLSDIPIYVRFLVVLLFVGLALLFFASFPIENIEDQSSLHLSVIHTNDVHSRVDQINSFATDCTPAQYEAKKCYGGTARHKTLIDRLRTRNKNSLLLDGGDEFQGTLFYTYYKGNKTADVMNILGYNLSTIGNHEFDDGPDTLLKYYKRLKTPIVCANIDTTKNPNLGQYIKPYHIFEEYNLAIIGYITKMAGGISNAGPTLSFSDPIPIVQKHVDELHAKGIKRIFTLSHNGYEGDKVLAAQTYGVALHIGGHSHTLLSNRTSDASDAKGPYPTTVKNAKGEDTLIVQAYWGGKYIGYLDILIDAEGKILKYEGEPILVDQSIPQDPEIKSLVSSWRQPFDEFVKAVIGEAKEDFDQSKCQDAECQMGNLVTDAMLNYRTKSSIRVNAALINAGGIRTGLLKGNITIENILTVLPFGSSLVDIDVTGKNITDILESVVGKNKNIVSGKPVTSFIQISGIQFTYNSSKEIFKRVVEVKIRDPSTKEYTMLDPKQVYTLTTLDFVANTGDGILATPIEGLVPLDAIDKVVNDYIAEQKVITPYLDGRIKDVAASTRHIGKLENDAPLHYRYTRALNENENDQDGKKSNPRPRIHYKNINLLSLL
ncbi:9020_t:CDS:2 [Ambispora leptoticha]|uniref:9020_t:CDS:1 n=1 Tax=Ambispora leptoticha TaxID=144679 RepID=A0A9N9G1E0_9GLOM|nr:9020_t:CDS:2 [Ambispora leptoticha]